jgi:hypothetical protein
MARQQALWGGFRFTVQGLGFRVQGSGVRVEGVEGEGPHLSRSLRGKSTLRIGEGFTCLHRRAMSLTYEPASKALHSGLVSKAHGGGLALRLIDSCLISGGGRVHLASPHLLTGVPRS